MSTGVITWSKTAATNSGADTAVNWAEGQAPSTVNDSARAMMAATAKWRDDTNGSLATTGGTTAYVLTTNQTFAALTAGYQVAFQINATNTGTSTLNVDSLGAKPLRKAANVEVVAGDLLIGRVYNATYFTSNSGEWLLHDASPTVIAADQVVTASILDANVTLAKMANLATQKLIGRNTGSTGVPEAVTVQQVLNWIASSARGDLIVRGASDWDRLAKGAAGYVLTSDGTDAAWALPVRRKLSTQTASTSASLAFTSSIDSTYRKYVFEIDNLLPATDDVQLICEVSVDAGSNWKTSSYLSALLSVDTGGSAAGANATASIVLSHAAGGSIGVDNGTGYGWSGTAELITPSNATTRKTVNITAGTYLRGGGTALQAGITGGGFWNGGNDAITGIRFRFSSGNIASGSIVMYGVV